MESNTERDNFITDVESAKFVQIMEDSKEKQNMIVSNFISVSDLNMDEKIVKNKQWIEFGENNLFPQELIDINLRSSKNYSILKNIANMIKGNGFIETPENKTFLENPNSKDSIDDILEKIVIDFAISGYFCLNIVWSRDGKKISKIKYIPFQKIRVGKQNEDEDNDESIDDYWISNDWNDIKKNPPEFINGYNPNNTKQRSQLLMVKRNTPGLEYYTLPHYIGAINWVRLDHLVSDYHLQNAVNGYFPSMVMNIATGIPSEEKQRNIKRKLDEQFKGTKRAGSMILTFSEGKEQAPEIIPLNLSDSDQKFLEVEKLVLDNLLISHNITNPQLVGIKTPGELGGTQELVESFNLLNINLINSFQKVIEKTFTELYFYHINGGNEKLVISELRYIEEKIINTNDTNPININTGS